MTSKKKRGVLASAAALITATALALGGSVAANADVGGIADGMPADSAVIITKLEQPAAPGTPATGLDQGLVGGIDGVTFKAYAVPVLDGTTPLTPGTNAWQEQVASMDVAAAQAALPDPLPTNPYREGTTADGGIIKWETAASPNQGNNLERGLYLVKETGTPAGVVASGDFLIAVPLTHPTQLNAWLNTIYVYPKNRTLEGAKTVVNAGDFSVGNTVTWTIDLDNPSTRDQSTGAFVSTDRFQVLDTIEDEYLTATAAGVNATVPAGLIKGTDYTVDLVAGDSTDGVDGNTILVGFTQIQITFTDTGRAKLATEMNKTQNRAENVVITIDTVVNKVGVIENSAQFYSSSSQTDPKEVPGTDVRYGNITLAKKSSKGDIDLTGAEFRVYLSEEAAKNKSNTSYVALTNPDGYLVTAEQPDGLWVTDAGGEISVGGFRYSGFADGESFDDTDGRYQTYWLVETKALPGHQLLAQPESFIVDSHDGSVKVEITNVADGGFVLPLTGGTGTLFLTIGGIALLALVLVVVARRRRGAEVSAE